MKAEEALKLIRRPIPVLGGVHRGMDLALRALGCRWELRRFGETPIGLWKLKVGDGSKKRPVPRRLVMIPGFGDTSLTWVGQAALLKPALRRAGYDEAVVFDLPGFHGFLSDERAFSSFDDFFAATSDALDSLKPYAVVGHSLGGWVAGHYAASCGEGRRAHVGGYPGPELLIVVNASGVYAAREELESFRQVFESAITDGFDRLRPHVFGAEPFWFKLLASEFGGFIKRPDIVQFLRSFEDRHLLQERLAGVRARTWVIWGEKDSLAPSAWASAWLSRLTHPEARARGVLLPGIGHSPHFEAPAVMTALLAQIALGREPHRAGRRWWRLIA